MPDIGHLFLTAYIFSVHMAEVTPTPVASARQAGRVGGGSPALVARYHTMHVPGRHGGWRRRRRRR